MSAEIVHEPFELDNQKRAKPLLTNALRLLDALGERISFDEMRGRIVCRDVAEHGHMPDGFWTDTHTIALLAVCEACKLEASKATVQDAVALHAKRNSFNSLRDWLTQAAKRWDGEARVDRAMVDYWGAADNAASIATGRIFLLSLAARGLEPGCKVDTCPIFIGPQGTFKSTALSVLAGGPEYFGDSPLPIGDKDALEVIRGKWLWEIGENAGMSARDQNKVKAFMSSPSDTFRASYGRFSEDVPRTCVFAATSNDHEVLHDVTGARRNMPIEVTRIDIEGLRRDREQLLGEAAFRVLEGEQYWPTAAEDSALKSVHSEHQESDAWDETLSAWLGARRSAANEQLRREAASSSRAEAIAREREAYRLAQNEGRKPNKAQEKFTAQRAEQEIAALAKAARDAATKLAASETAEADGGADPFTLDDIFKAEQRDSAGRAIEGTGGPIPTPIGQRTKASEMRAAKVLTRLGWQRGNQERRNGARVRLWRPAP